MDLDIVAEVAIVALCLAAGGVLKGATGAGAPILAVPAITAMFDVRFAVMVMLVPNVFTNIWQVWRYRERLPSSGFMLLLLTGGAFGIVTGTWALKSLASDTLSLVMAGAVFAYIALRLMRPHWSLPMRIGRKLAFPAGLASGILQGSAGISAPVSITFLHSLQLGREAFIATISSQFVVLTVIQIVATAYGGLLGPSDLMFSALALLPVALGMPLGSALARRASPATMDRVVLVILAAIAAKLLFDAVAA